ncbi:MAG TPA: hypothetical protein VFY54_00205 [Rubrobacter sp.]|nr:hypothetical protein [Rubrobacter sp.]
MESGAEEDSVLTPAEARKEQLGLLEGHISKLKDETAGWLDRQARLWQTAIAGIAAIAVFRGDTDIELYLPFAPIVVLALGAQWLRLQTMLVRVGRAMAIGEVRINALVGSNILTHELDLWDRRSATLKRLRRYRGLLIAGVVLLSLVYGGFVAFTLRDLTPTAVQVIYALGAGIVLAFALGSLWGVYRLRRLPGPRTRAQRAR